MIQIYDREAALMAVHESGELYVLGNQTGVVSGSTGLVERITAG